MTEWAASGLSKSQRDFVVSMLGDDLDLVSDMSWGQVDTRVLRVMAGTEHFVVKAAGPSNHHIGREISAHETATGPLLSRDLCARLVGADRDSNILVTTFVRGELVEGTPAELSPEVQAQAGALLRAFHSQSARLDDEYEARVTHQALQRLRPRPSHPGRHRGSRPGNLERVLAAPDSGCANSWRLATAQLGVRRYAGTRD